MYLHSKYKSIARTKCFTPGTPSSMETIGVKVMLITSGADLTVFAHWAWLWTRSSPPLLLKITVTSCKKLGPWVIYLETQANRSIVSHMLNQVKNDLNGLQWQLLESLKTYSPTEQCTCLLSTHLILVAQGGSSWPTFWIKKTLFPNLFHIMLNLKLW